MIKAGQMQHPVQDQNLQFIGRGMAITRGVLARNVGRDSDIATVIARKGKNVGRLILFAKTPVELLYPAVPGNQDVHFAVDAGQFLGPAGKADHARPVHAKCRFFEDDHVVRNRKGRAARPPLP